MNLRKHGPRALGLSILAALGLMAFTASAQATTGLFLISGKAALKATATGNLDPSTLGLLLVPALGVEIHCTGLTVRAGSELKSDTEGLASLTYTGCVYYQLAALPAKPGKNCTITNGSITALAVLRPVLIGGQQLLVLAEGEAGAGKLFATVNSTGCTVPETSRIEGSVVLKTKEHEVGKQLLTATTLSLPGNPDGLTYLGSPATIDGAVEIELTGAHAGLPFGSI